MAEPFSREQIVRAWADALGVWEVSTLLSPPQAWDGKGRDHWQGEEPLAFIDLETRQVVVNYRLLSDMGAAGSLTGVLAHEIGHHVRFPHTLRLAAGLQMLEKRLIPGLGSSLTNLYFDLQVNEVVGRTRAEDLCAVYRAFLKDPRARARPRKPQAKPKEGEAPVAGGPDPGDVPIEPAFYFYLSIYEELWGLAPGALVPPEMIAPMETAYPGCRADARVFAATFFPEHDPHLQFVYFCGVFIRYIPDPARFSLTVPLGHDVPPPGLDDVDAVLRGGGQDEVEKALEEARARGWIKDAGLVDREDPDPLTSIDRITTHRPGMGAAEFKLALVSRHYKHLVDQHLIDPPPTQPRPEPFLPTVTEDWEPGDSPAAIDWTATVLQQGALAAIRPLKRDLDPDEPSPMARQFPAIEIYLDTSGSMPNPVTSLNAMTLAAQILAASALRKKGTVRGIVYSWGKPMVSPWMYDEETARRFLLHYAGGGTDFPFALCAKFAEERPDAVRVAISDSDFLYNAQGAGALDRLAYAVDKSYLFVAFLAADEASARTSLARVLPLPKFRLAMVKGLDEFARAAATLADALFPRGARAV